MPHTSYAFVAFAPVLKEPWHEQESHVRGGYAVYNGKRPGNLPALAQPTFFRHKYGTKAPLNHLSTGNVYVNTCHQNIRVEWGGLLALNRPQTP